jgi:hypothetical protein
VKYRKGDMVKINDPGSPFHLINGLVVYTDKEALRVDIAPKWYWGEGDVTEYTWEGAKSLEALPVGTITEEENGTEWVKISPATWATQRKGGFHTIAAMTNMELASLKVRRTFLGRML